MSFVNIHVCATRRLHYIVQLFTAKKRHYVRTFFHVMDMAVVNGRLSLYTRDSADCRETGDTNPMPFFEFKASVSLALLNARKSRKRLGRISLQDQEHAAGSKRGGPKTVLTTPDIRLDEMNH